MQAYSGRLFFAAVASLALLGVAQPPAAVSGSAIAANENRVAAGSTLADGTRAVTLNAQLGTWYPDGPGTIGVPIAAFGEPGKPLQIPGPLIRVPAGTTVVVTLHNGLPDRTMRIVGLAVAADGDHPVVLRPGETRTVRFRRDVPGTYGYRTGDERDSERSRFDYDAALNGAIVIDDPHRPPPDDRVFVIMNWDHVWKKSGKPNFRGEVLAINGRSWPATERLSYRQGSTVRWRVFNASVAPHPMHLHGFWFNVDAVGDGVRTASHAGKPPIREVTHRVAPGETFDAHWIADRPGDWMFHCHLTFHLLPHAPLTPLIAGKSDDPTFEDRFHFTHDGVGGMMFALQVTPAHGPAAVRRPADARRLALDVIETEKPAKQRFPIERFAYVLHDGTATVQPTGALGPLIVLEAGQPTALTVTNRLREATTVHWHGMPVQYSIDDGGMASMAMAGMPATAASSPAIVPGGSYVARFTAPYAGTYLYHTHMDDIWQLAGGLSGPLVVLPPGSRFDARTDHVVMVTSTADQLAGDKVEINGFVAPPPIVVHAGVVQRLRLINMTLGNPDLVLSLDGPAASMWTPIAKDGRDLDKQYQITRRATQALTIGETRDFSFLPAMPGHFTLNAYDGGLIGGLPIEVIP